MRPQRFQHFAITALTQAPGIQTAEPWTEGTSRPRGMQVALASGAQLWLAITAQARAGDNYESPEQPVERDAPAPVELPHLSSGKSTIRDIEHYLTAVLTNTGSREMRDAWAYSDRQQTPKIPGIGVAFHNGAKIFMPFVHAALRPGQSPSRKYDLPQEV